LPRFQPLALAGELEDSAMMYESSDHGGGSHWIRKMFVQSENARFVVIAILMR
jgi:hypothetical protein